jgi:pimeloyl-ACP methyl ester carboxylesterase
MNTVRKPAAPAETLLFARPLPHVEGVRHRFIETSRLRVHVAEAGEGEPVVLVHGWPQHWYAWRDVIPLLAADYHVLCPDLRGFGWSEATRDGYGTNELVDDLLSLLDALGLERVHIVGHELGGRLGFHLSLRQPERVRALLALNALHPYWSVRRLAPHAWRQWWTVFVETPFVGRTVLRQLPAFTRMLFRMGQPDTELRSASAIEEFVAPLREPAHARAAERVQTCFAYRELVPTLLGRYRSARLRVPTLMLNGTKDFALSPSELGGFERFADDLQIELVADGGHSLAEQHPRLVADRAARFFSGRTAIEAAQLGHTRSPDPASPRANHSATWGRHGHP